jgi:molybdenum transport protein
MIYFTDQEIDQLMMEDVPYSDITTSLLKLENKPAKIQVSTREPAVVCCTEEVMKIFNRTGVQTTLFTPSGEHLEKGVKFLEGEGLSGTLFALSRTIDNLLRYATGIATRTRLMVEKAQSVNKNIMIVTTRKTIPYTRKIAIKAVNSGGAAVHRLGLSESILIYKNHYGFLGGLANLEKRIAERKMQSGGKSITVEVNSLEEARMIAASNIDIIQMDHFTVSDIRKLKSEIKKINPSVKLAASGNITLKNIQDFAASGADLLISSWPYYGEPCDMSINILPIYDTF